jgi:hypothetical protein
VSTELYLTAYVLIALIVAVIVRLTILDDYDELAWASTLGVFWIIIVPIAVFLVIVDTSTKAIEELKEKSK